MTFQKRNGNVKAKTCQKLFDDIFFTSYYCTRYASRLLVVGWMATSFYPDGDRFFQSCAVFVFFLAYKRK